MQPMEVFEIMVAEYGRQDWWPAGHGLSPEGWEVCVGAILTQNTAWKNAELALNNLSSAGCRTFMDMLSIDLKLLAGLVRPSGYYNQKAGKLKSLASFVGSFGSFEAFLAKATREGLLSVKGIGQETADSILLYACGRPEFVADAYTKRVFSRLGLVGEADYEDVKRFFESCLERDASLFNEYHALIVEHAKNVCRKRPLCGKCPLANHCMFSKKNLEPQKGSNAAKA